MMISLCIIFFFTSICHMYFQNFVHSFQIFSTKNNYSHRNHQLLMKWKFGSKSNIPGQSSQKTDNLVGSDGEFYFHPSKSTKIQAPVNIVENNLLLPLYPYTNVLLPGGDDVINVIEMRHRQMFNEIEDGYFTMGYYSQQLQRLSLVGTIVKVTNRRRLDDGRMTIMVEGVKKCYLDKVISEKPYIKGVVTPFMDYTESPSILDKLEMQIYAEVCGNLKMMKILFPSKSFSLSPALLENRPYTNTPGIRPVLFDNDPNDLLRRMKFSYAVIDMLQIAPTLKLSLMQEHIIEKRYTKCLNILERGANYIREELSNRGIVSEEIDIQTQLTNTPDILTNIDEKLWIPENFKDGSWVQMPIMM